MVKGKGSWEIHMIVQRSEKSLNSSSGGNGGGGGRSIYVTFHDSYGTKWQQGIMNQDGLQITVL